MKDIKIVHNLGITYQNSFSMFEYQYSLLTVLTVVIKNWLPLAKKLKIRQKLLNFRFLEGKHREISLKFLLK